MIDYRIFGLKKDQLRKAAYLPILATAMVLMFARLLLFAKILDVNSFAELSAALIVSGIVGMLSSLGLYLDLQRKLPGYLARGMKRSAAASILRSMLGTAVIGAVGLAISLVVASLEGVGRNLMLLGVLHGVTQQAFLIQTTESRSNRDPFRFALQNMARSLGILLLSVPISVKYGSAASVLITECMVTVILVIIISQKSLSRLGIGHRYATCLAIRSLKFTNWKSISTLLFLSLVVTCSMSVDKWLASLTLLPVKFAQYSFASIIMTAAFAAQALVNASIFPIIATKFSVLGMNPAYKLTRLTSLAILCAFLLAMGPAIYLANIAINTVYPKYSEAVEIVPIFALTAAFRVSDFWTSFLIISGKERTSLIINFAGVAIGFASWYCGFFGELSTEKSLGILALFIAFFTYVVSSLYSYMLYRGSSH